MTSYMKCAQWNQCSEVSIRSELINLQEVEANLRDLLSFPLHGEAPTAGGVAVALSFIRLASQALLQPNSNDDA